MKALIQKNSSKQRGKTLRTKNKVAGLKRTIDSQRKEIEALASTRIDVQKGRMQGSVTHNRSSSKNHVKNKKSQQQTDKYARSARKPESTVRTDTQNVTISSPKALFSPLKNRLLEYAATNESRGEEERVFCLERELAGLRQQYKGLIEKCQNPAYAAMVNSLKLELNNTARLLEEKSNLLFEAKNKGTTY